MPISVTRKIDCRTGSKEGQFISSLFGSPMRFQKICSSIGRQNVSVGCVFIPSRGRTKYHRRFSGTIEHWLDSGHGSCLLRQREYAKLVGGALQHFDGIRYAQIAWVVMPNHVHTLFVQQADWPLERLIHSWKLFTARRINKPVGRAGSLWQRDYFDRLVGDRPHLSNCVRYIRRNPGRARLRAGEYVLFESDLARTIE